ncbi:MAG: hypothetical protein PHN55_07715 [Dysgonamonadaceae bacterium]|jgi:hypothetical protein|nr:hypothetical protein [Dysgonamonadaceae bacterium]
MALGVEVYISVNTNCLITITDNVYCSGDILNKSVELQEFLDLFMLKTSTELVNLSATGESYLSNDEVRKKTTYACNGNNF